MSDELKLGIKALLKLLINAALDEDDKEKRTLLKTQILEGIDLL